MNYLIAYFVVGFLWCIYAGWMQFKAGFSTSIDWRFCVCVLCNLVFWPYGIFVAWSESREGD